MYYVQPHLCLLSECPRGAAAGDTEGRDLEWRWHKMSQRRIDDTSYLATVQLDFDSPEDKKSTQVELNEVREEKPA